MTEILHYDFEWHFPFSPWVFDKSWHWNWGTMKNGAHIEDGKLVLDGEDDYVKIDADVNEMEDWTVSLRMTFKQLPLAERRYYLTTRGVNPNTRAGGNLRFGVNKREKFQLYGGAGITGHLRYPVPGDWKAGGWHRVTVKQVRSEDKRYLYLDGELATTDSNPDMNNITRIGAISRRDAYYWYGKIDELCIYDRPLSMK